MKIRLIVTSWIVSWFFVTAQAALHPKIQAAFEETYLPEGVIFDVQSADANYFNEHIDYLVEQVQSVYEASPSIQLVLLSRGREIGALATAQYNTQAWKKLQLLHTEYGLQIEIDIAVAAALGFNEGSFPKHVSIISNPYVSLVEGRDNDFIVLELAHMSEAEQANVQLSPTWRTDWLEY